MPSIENDVFLEKIELPKEDEDLIRVYRDVGRTVDDLAYTPEFDQLFESYLRTGHQASKHDVFRRLLILRKYGLLPRLFRPNLASADAGLSNAG